MFSKLFCVAALVSVALGVSSSIYFVNSATASNCSFEPTGHGAPHEPITHAQIARRDHFGKRCAAASGEMFAKRKAAKRDLLTKRWTPQNDTIQNTTCILDTDVTQCVLFPNDFFPSRKWII